MFIKELYNAERTIRNNLTLLEKGSPEWLLEKSKMQVLGRIIKYIRTEGVKRGTAKAKLNAIMQTHFDYERVGAMFNTSANSIQVSISYLSKNLESKVGKDTIDLLLAGQIDEAISNFRACSNIYSLDKLIPTEFAQKIPLKLPKTIDLTECNVELEFLRAISFSKVNKDFSKLDLEKLILIKYILQSRDKRYSDERQALYKYILGNQNDELDG